MAKNHSETGQKEAESARLSRRMSRVRAPSAPPLFREWKHRHQKVFQVLSRKAFLLGYTSQKVHR